MGILTGLATFLCGLLLASAVGFVTLAYVVPPVLSADLPGVMEEHTPAVKAHTDVGVNELSKGTDAIQSEMDDETTKRSNGTPGRH